MGFNSGFKGLIWSQNFPVWFFFCLFVLFFYPFNLPLILKDFPHGKHTANATKIFCLLHTVFIPKYLYLTSQFQCATSVSCFLFLQMGSDQYFGLTLKINALHAWVTRYSLLFCYCLVCFRSVFWFWESSWLLSPQRLIAIWKVKHALSIIE